jgi:NADH-quinone oxidoreductase subunit G
MSDDVINIEVDGKPVEARRGQMVIEVTDRVGAYIPRFCYHEKLSIAANCRMCLVEVEKAPKPLPACATPVGEGMKVFTRSAKAIAAQKATMEFLLINHPLDCPICDQGGECELQDLAMGYGRDVSRYNDGKRVVKDKDIGPLVSTDMTRCIHCTRCVRFGEEISGKPQLGITKRGENSEIGTYVEQSVDHELSANIIDLCPVGALNNKPYRYSARSWEMVQQPTISPHDCVGSNMYAHVLRGTIKRVVPRENEGINETWLSDRDRFSYEAIYSPDRLLAPQVKEAGEWRDIDWEPALALAAQRLSSAAEGKLGFLASPSATLEEGHLLRLLADHLGTDNIDHRIERRDFADQENDPPFPWLGCDIADIEAFDAILVVGSNLRQEAPILAHRLRKAALAGARIHFVSSKRHEYFFDIASYLSGAGLVELLTGAAMEPVAAELRNADKALVLLGNIAARHEAFSVVRSLTAGIAADAGATLGTLSPGANSAGLSLAGVRPRTAAGLHAGAMLSETLDTTLLLNIEPDKDLLASSDAVDKLADDGFVIALTPFDSAALRAGADLLLPVGTFAESSGTCVNVAGTWQSFGGVATPVGEARPAWKVLRVLGNLTDAPGFNYVTSQDVRDELAEQLGTVSGDNSYAGSVTDAPLNGEDSPDAEIDTPIYSVDPLVRRAPALQMTPAAKRAAQGEG